MQSNSLTRLSGRTKQSTSRQRAFIKDNIVRTTMKKCTMCRETKVELSFSKDSRAKDGRHCYCKECRRELRGSKPRKEVISTVKFKICSKCGIKLPAKAFSGDSRAYSGLYSSCKICRSTSRAKVSSLVEKHLACMRSIKLRYNLSELELQDKLLDQQGCCEICGIDFGEAQQSLKRAYCVDHDHKTNTTRGLLCYKCNRVVSYLDLGRRTFYDRKLYDKYIKKYSSQAE